jgi:hypothetical protein
LGFGSRESTTIIPCLASCGIDSEAAQYFGAWPSSRTIMVSLAAQATRREMEKRY